MSIKKTKKSINIGYCERHQRLFDRIVLKKVNARKIEIARKELELPNGKSQETITISRVKKFHLFLASLFADKNEFFKELQICLELLNKIDLPEGYFYPLLVYLYTGETQKENFKIDVAVIQSKRMTSKIEEKVRLAKDDFSKSVVSGRFDHLESWPDTHPISIKISPLSSIEEIIDFIRRSDKEIREHQKLYASQYLRKIKNLKAYQFLDNQKQQEPKKSWENIKKVFDSVKEFSDIDVTKEELAKFYAKGKKYLR